MYMLSDADAPQQTTLARKVVVTRELNTDVQAHPTTLAGGVKGQLTGVVPWELVAHRGLEAIQGNTALGEAPQPPVRTVSPGLHCKAINTVVAFQCCKVSAFDK